MNDRTVSDWEGKWQQGNTQWDKGVPSPALISLFENAEAKSLIPESGQALVPGCGSGYDVVFLANKSRHVTGLDMSKTCIEKQLKNHPNAEADNYEFMCDDFYKFKIPTDGYDLAYDYTFLCAMPPGLRLDLASRYAEIIKKDGVLITLIFPIADHEGGPPYAVSEQL
ncbi:S-adenosyl-L-methionine-dependent methyltransferase [Backusella circina FSU 941]|nr:S-adenosyl-L-methionine-dependent methyltransferase [Backusella circina FSU 941]